MPQKVIWSIKMNRCWVSYCMINKPSKEWQVKVIQKKLKENPELKPSHLISKKLLPFTNGKLAPAQYFYSLFTIEELNNKDFKPKIFLVIDKELDGKCIKIGNLIIIKLIYIDLK